MLKFKKDDKVLKYYKERKICGIVILPTLDGKLIVEFKTAKATWREVVQPKEILLDDGTYIYDNGKKQDSKKTN